MKRKKLFGAALALIVLGGACKNDDYRDGGPSVDGVVKFSSSIGDRIATRAAGNKWDANDAIGVFMKQGADLSNPLAVNKKYTTNGDGQFSGQGNEVINYPESGKVDFVAYYPYNKELSGAKLPISVESQENLAAVDVLYSNNAKGLDKNSGTAKLNFTHKLTKIELSVKAGNGVADVNGLNVNYNSVLTTSEMDLATGIIGTASNKKNVKAKTTAVESTQLVEAILIPGDFSNKEVVFTLATGTFRWTLPANTKYESGKKHTYNIVLQTGSSGNEVEVKGEGTITDWEDVPGGSVDVDKDDDGTTEPGQEQTLFFETFGEKTTSSSPKGRFETFDDFDEKNVKYSDLYPDSWADIRATSTLNTHSWLPANRTTGFKVEGINIAGAKDIKLSYNIAANQAGVAYATVKIKANGQDLAMPAGNLTDQNKFELIEIPISISEAASLTLEFSAETAANKAGFRVDNIKVVGTK